MDTPKSLIKAALAALSQNATYQADIDYAKRCLRDALQIQAYTPALLAALREPCGEPSNRLPDFASDLELIAAILENENYILPGAALRTKAAAIRAAIAAAEGVTE